MISNKKLNEELVSICKHIGELNGTYACSTCDKSYCCEYQTKINIGAAEFDDIEHLVTPIQIARAKQQIENKTPIIVDGKKTYRCPFLSDKGKCEIYDERFIVCASYSVIGDNLACNQDSDIPNVSVIAPLNVLGASLQNPKQRDRFTHSLSKEGSDILEEFRKRYKL